VYQVKALAIGGAMRDEPVAYFRAAIAGRRQTLIEERQQRIVLARRQMLQAFAVEDFVDGAHRGIANRVAHRHAKGSMAEFQTPTVVAVKAS
jgi:hypothetical protein